MSAIDDVLNSFPETQSAALWSTLRTLRKLLPQAQEDISWGMPTLRCEGIIVTSLMGFHNHNSLFPGSEVHEIMGSALEGYTVTKGTIHFDKTRRHRKDFSPHSFALESPLSTLASPRNLASFVSCMRMGCSKLVESIAARACMGRGASTARTGH